MIVKLIQNVWIFLFMYIGYDVYLQYSSHQENLEAVKAQIPGINASIRTKQKKVKELEKYFSDIDSAKNKIKKVTEEVEKIQKRFPSGINDSVYISALKEFAKSLRIKKSNISSGSEVDKGFYFIKSFEFSGQATYLQFLILLERIQNFEKLLNVSKITFSEISEKQKGRFQLVDAKISIEAYRHDPNHKESSGIEDIEKNFKSKKNKKNKKQNKKNKKRGRK